MEVIVPLLPNEFNALLVLPGDFDVGQEGGVFGKNHLSRTLERSLIVVLCLLNGPLDTVGTCCRFFVGANCCPDVMVGGNDSVLGKQVPVGL